MAIPTSNNPRPDGNVRMPSIGPGMNKLPPKSEKISANRATKGDRALRKKEAENKAKRDEEILTRARKRFNRCVTAESDNRKAGVDDLKFLSGEAQWPADVVSERNFDKRPTLTINKLPTFVNQVVNDQRMNRPAINISPVGDKSDPEVAKMYRGLIRFIERDSSADIAYDTAFANAAGAPGFGYWRIVLEYESPESFDQVIVIRRVRNPFTVYFDPASKEPDGSDGRYAFVTEMIPRKEFEDDYPDADPMPWAEGGFGEDFKNWVSSDEIRVAEYFEITVEKRKLVELRNGHVGWEDELDESVSSDDIEYERWSDWPKLMWYKMSATTLLDEREWPGKWIPIVKEIGNEIDIEGKVRLSGIVRNAKQPQMLYNYNRTLSVELSSQQPKAPYLVVEGQVEGYEQEWKQANIKPYPYLTYRSVDIEGKPAPPPQRQPFAGPPQAVLAEVQAAEQDLIGTTGIRFSATREERMYDESGRALRELRKAGDLGSFHYIDNHARSLRHCGQILVDLIPKVYERKRVVTILREDDSEEQVQLDPSANQPFVRGRNPANNKAMKIYNPTYGKYGVTVTIGPSYATKRIESAESILDFMRAFGAAAPNLVPMIADLVAKNQDWDGSEQIAKRLASQLPPQMLMQGMEDLPPQAAAIIGSLQNQLQALNNEKQQMLRALTEQQSDRAQRQSQIDNDFEARLLNTMANFEAKMAAVQQKQEQAITDRVMSPISELIQGVAALREALAASRETIQ